jgi:hypothetical protein
MKDRLDYIYYDMETRKEHRTTEGIPQGGIDSPDLFNLYMMEFDEFVHTELQKYIDSLNSHGSDRIPMTKAGQNRKKVRYNLKEKITRDRTQIKRGRLLPRREEQRAILYPLIKKLRIMNHKYRNTENYQQNKKKIRSKNRKTEIHR